ncbi:MAG TPA: NAD(P)/FAD-dependent oxidoreductase [Terriglobales bacterium]|nr:NAD(P)/FAD-dependent oxidoreductase [Terriglobales bacterium]
MVTRLVTEVFDVIVIGAGAAGLLCAIEAGKRGRRVAVLDHSARIGRKILISGGGRCNFTNIHCRPENFVSANPHFCKSALARYTPSDFVELIEKHKIRYHEKTLGQLFCDGSAGEILNMLERECQVAGVRIVAGTQVTQVRHSSEFTLQTDQGELKTPALVVATGGLSIPKIGATGFGYQLARQFGLAVREPRPALVPLTFNRDDRERYCDLSGVSAEVIASADHQRFREKMLITHRGLSGPAILQISSYWNGSDPITIDLAPGKDVTAALRDPRSRRDLSTAKAVLRTVLPNRFAERWLEMNAPSKWTNQGLSELESRLHHWNVMPDGTEGYEKAEVTAGGIDTNELSAKTMESRKVPGLFFIGEVVDVTGQLGGFNFQWAWASGYCAGQAV